MLSGEDADAVGPADLQPASSGHGGPQESLVGQQESAGRAVGPPMRLEDQGGLAALAPTSSHATPMGAPAASAAAAAQNGMAEAPAPAGEEEAPPAPLPAASALDEAAAASSGAAPAPAPTDTSAPSPQVTASAVQQHTPAGSVGHEAESDAAAGGAVEGGSGSKPVVKTREQFVEVWQQFMTSRRLEPTMPLFNRNVLDLFKLFRLVMKAGGYEAVLAQKGWAREGRAFNPPSSMTDLSFQIKRIYINKLLEFEKAYTAGDIDAEIQMDVAAPPSAAGTPEPSARQKQEQQQAPPAVESPQPRPPSRPRSRSKPAGAGRGASKPASRAATPTISGAPKAATPAAAPAAAAEGAGWAARMPAWPAAAPAPAGRQPSRPPSAAAAGRASQQGRPGAASALAEPAPTGVMRPPSSQRAPRARRARLRSTQPATSPSPQSMLGRRIGVFWAEEDVYYYGTVVDYDAAEQEHTIVYDDGDSERLALAYENWVFADQQPAASGGAVPAAAAAPPSTQQGMGGPAAAEEAAAAEQLPKRARTGEAAAAAAEASAGQQQQQQQLLGAELLGALAGQADLQAAARPVSPAAAATDAGISGSLELPAQYQQQYQQYPQDQAGLFGMHRAPSPYLPAPTGGFPTAAPAAPAAAAAAAAGGPAAGVLPPASLFQPAPPAPLVPTHQQPQELVASGRNYRVFTASAPPPGFEIFMLLPGLAIDEVSVRCWSSGLVLIKGEPRRPGSSAGGWAAAPSSETIQLPSRINTQSAQALFTQAGQLYVRIDRKE